MNAAAVCGGAPQGTAGCGDGVRGSSGPDNCILRAARYAGSAARGIQQGVMARVSRGAKRAPPHRSPASAHTGCGCARPAHPRPQAPPPRPPASGSHPPPLPRSRPRCRWHWRGGAARARVGRRCGVGRRCRRCTCDCARASWEGPGVGRRAVASRHAGSMKRTTPCWRVPIRAAGVLWHAFAHACWHACMYASACWRAGGARAAHRSLRRRPWAAAMARDAAPWFSLYNCGRGAVHWGAAHGTAAPWMRRMRARCLGDAGRPAPAMRSQRTHLMDLEGLVQE